MSGPRLVLDAEPTQVAVARAFAVAVMRVLEFDDDRVASIRLAVSELMTELVLAGVDEVGLEFDGGVLRIWVVRPERPPGPPQLGDRSLRLLSECLDGEPTPNASGGWDVALVEVTA